MIKRFFIQIKTKAVALNEFFKKMEQLPMRGFRDEYFDEDDTKKHKPAPRKNKVKVEDLRPQKPKD